LKTSIVSRILTPTGEAMGNPLKEMSSLCYLQSSAEKWFILLSPQSG
jgi:hypothetical protein